jgi:hypothetical protein
MRSCLRRLLVIPAIALTLLPFVASAHAQYVCRMTGRVIERRCCPTEAVDRDAPCTTRISADECCERLSPARFPAAPATRDAGHQIASAALLAFVSADSLFAPAASLAHRTRPASQAPRVLGPPLFIVHCALLN